MLPADDATALEARRQDVVIRPDGSVVLDVLFARPHDFDRAATCFAIRAASYAIPASRRRPKPPPIR